MFILYVLVAIGAAIVLAFICDIISEYITNKNFYNNVLSIRYECQDNDFIFTYKDKEFKIRVNAIYNELGNNIYSVFINNEHIVDTYKIKCNFGSVYGFIDKSYDYSKNNYGRDMSEVRDILKQASNERMKRILEDYTHKFNSKSYFN